MRRAGFDKQLRRVFTFITGLTVLVGVVAILSNRYLVENHRALIQNNLPAAALTRQIQADSPGATYGDPRYVHVMRALRDVPRSSPDRARADAFALLSAAVRRAMPSREGETHRLPSALLDLADLALDVGRPELAARLLRMRQECGPCPRTQRIALRLPPDLDPP